MNNQTETKTEATYWLMEAPFNLPNEEGKVMYADIYGPFPCVKAAEERMIELAKRECLINKIPYDQYDPEEYVIVKRVKSIEVNLNSLGEGTIEEVEPIFR